MTGRIVSIILSTFFICCGKPKEKKEPSKAENKTTQQDSNYLIDHVKLAINPQFKDWVLFENGTYIIFDDVSKINNIEQEALKLMKEFGPVFTGGSAGDFNVISLTKTKGWLVTGHCYGMYTYVNPNELDSKSYDDITVGLFGRSKRDKDGKNPKIIHINKS